MRRSAEARLLDKEEAGCVDVVRCLDDYVAGELSAAGSARLQAHIEGCEKCRRYELSYRWTIELAAELRDVPAPQEVRSRLRQSLNEKLGITLPVSQ